MLRCVGQDTAYWVFLISFGGARICFVFNSLILRFHTFEFFLRALSRKKNSFHFLAYTEMYWLFFLRLASQISGESFEVCDQTEYVT